MTDLTQRLFARTESLAIGSSTRQLAVIVGLVAVAWTWASWATLQEQIRSQGQVIVSSRSQVVQAVDGGVLKKLNVKEGATVKAGDLLAELDPVRFQASNDEIVARVISLKANIQRLEAELSESPLAFSDDVKAYTDIVQAQQRLHQRRAELQREELSAIDRSLALATEELKSLERLAATGDAAQTEVLRARRQANELRGNYTNKHNGYRQEAQAELAKSRSELEAAEQQLAQKREALAATRLHAPMSGIVKNVRITTIGGVLKAGDELLQIVPSDDPLIIEAKVKSADVGFVRLGLKANVKLDAYDYTIYGSMKGHVTYISPDTVQDPNPKQDEPPSYRVHVQIDEMPKNSSKPIEVIPGMLATVEIITGERTVAQYLLKPLRRVQSEALVER
jgi:adhesin transport system membrane fusion protein